MQITSLQPLVFKSSFKQIMPAVEDCFSIFKSLRHNYFSVVNINKIL